MKLLVLLAILIGAPCGAASAESIVWKIETELGPRIMVPGCDPEKQADCPDTVSYISRSKYGVNQYLTFIDSVRAQIGFGSEPNEVSLMEAWALHPGAYDWGGLEIRGVFKPLFLIKRFYSGSSDPTIVGVQVTTQLSIFRLKNDGTSCVVYAGRSTANNVTARKWAEQALTDQECLN